MPSFWDSRCLLGWCSCLRPALRLAREQPPETQCWEQPPPWRRYFDETEGPIGDDDHEDEFDDDLNRGWNGSLPPPMLPTTKARPDAKPWSPPTARSNRGMPNSRSASSRDAPPTPFIEVNSQNATKCCRCPNIIPVDADNLGCDFCADSACHFHIATIL